MLVLVLELIPDASLQRPIFNYTRGRTLSLYRRRCRISIAETQTCLPAMRPLSVYTYCTVQAFPVVAQETYFESLIPQILPKLESGRGSNIAMITNISQRCCRTSGILNISWSGKSFKRKKAVAISSLFFCPVVAWAASNKGHHTITCANL